MSETYYASYFGNKISKIQGRAFREEYEHKNDRKHFGNIFSETIACFRNFQIFLPPKFPIIHYFVLYISYYRQALYILLNARDFITSCNYYHIIMGKQRTS